MNEPMNENEKARRLVGSALPPLQSIDELYNTAMILTQQSEANLVTSKAGKTYIGTILGLVAGLLTWEIGGRMLMKLFFSMVQTIGMGSGTALALTYIIATVVAIIVYLKVKKFFNKPSKSATDLVNTNESQIQQISAEIERIATENAEIINQLPRDYRYYYAAQFFESALANGRADNMKEAVNLFEDELHKMRMENLSQQVLTANEQQCKMLESIEINSQRAATASEANLAFNVLTWINR